MGTLTATGGGATRDVLLAQVPMILRTDFYATAAILCCVTILLMRRCGFSMPVASGLGGLVCFAARLLGPFNHWHLPVFHWGIFARLVTCGHAIPQGLKRPYYPRTEVWSRLMPTLRIATSRM